MKSDEKTLNVFSTLVEGYGLLHGTVAAFGIGARISIAFPQRIYENPINELNLSVRGSNVLKRSGLDTVGDVIEAINDGSLISLRNLGKKTVAEIRATVLEYGYSQLRPQEKRAVILKIFRINTQDHG